MVKRVAAIVVLILVITAFAPIVTIMQERAGISELAAAYLRGSASDLRTANVVTAVVVTYRGLDTLGEVTVLFAAAAGAALVLAGVARRGAPPAADHGAASHTAATAAPIPPSEFLHTGAGLLAPIITLFGVFIFVHGHLTPGGGFQGGVVVASMALLMILSGHVTHLNHTLLGALEMVAGFAYVAVAILGLFLVAGFLDPRFLPTGEIGQLISGGAIPLIYIVVGVKVGAELSALMDAMRRPQ